MPEQELSQQGECLTSIYTLLIRMPNAGRMCASCVDVLQSGCEQQFGLHRAYKRTPSKMFARTFENDNRTDTVHGTILLGFSGTAHLS